MWRKIGPVFSNPDAYSFYQPMTASPPPVVYSIVESPAHPDCTTVCDKLGLQNLVFGSMRKAIAALRRTPPDVVVAEFFYGYGNNYAGVNVSNLDVFLHSLRKYAPRARVIVLADKTELDHIDKLRELFSIREVLAQPVTAQAIAEAVTRCGPPLP